MYVTINPSRMSRKNSFVIYYLEKNFFRRWIKNVLFFIFCVCLKNIRREDDRSLFFLHFFAEILIRYIVLNQHRDQRK